MSARATGGLALRPPVAAAAAGAAIRIVALLTGALALGAAAAMRPLAAIGLALAVSTVAAIAARPAVGVYALIVLTPLTAGIDRGTLLPLLRPNEAVDAIVALGLFLRWASGLRSAREVRVRVDAMSATLLALAVTSSILPLLWLKLRGQPVASDDMLYALLIWKFLVVYLIVRSAGLTERQVFVVLRCSVAAAVALAAIAMLQTAGWGPVVSLLKAYYTTNDNVGAITGARGSSTLGLPIAVADLLVFNLAIVMGLIWLRRRATPLLVGSGLVLTLGAIGAGEFSGVIGLLVGVTTLCILTRSVYSARFLLVGGVLAVPLLWPVIQTRLAGFQTLNGIPISWTGRLTNLHTYFWPVLFSDRHWVLGVRPAARIADPHRANGYVWIESGYTWLLWAGGIPLLLAFVAFVVVAARAMLRAIYGASDARRIAGLAGFVAVTMIVVLMAFDPHLTYRGVADELFALLAIAVPTVTSKRRGADHV